jgi:heme-degrading monooxygenase HmoA
MFARVTTIQTLPGKLDEAAALYRDAVAPHMKQQKGFHATYLLTDRDTGKAVSLTVWENETDGAAFDGNHGFQQQLAKVASLLASPPAREEFIVSVAEA